MGSKPWWDTLAWVFITHWFFSKSSIHASGMRACMAGPCNLTEWKDLKQKITDMAGKSHQRVARVSDCGTDVSFDGRSITANATEGGSAISPPPPLPPPLHFHHFHLPLCGVHHHSLLCFTGQSSSSSGWKQGNPSLYITPNPMPAFYPVSARPQTGQYLVPSLFRKDKILQFVNIIKLQHEQNDLNFNTYILQYNIIKYIIKLGSLKLQLIYLLGEIIRISVRLKADDLKPFNISDNYMLEIWTCFIKRKEFFQKAFNNQLWSIFWVIFEWGRRVSPD